MTTPVGGKIDITEASGADLPPVGTTRIVRVGGVTKQSVDGAPFSAIGGGSVGLSPWFSNVAAFVQNLQGTLVAATMVSDCVSTALELETPSATGTGVTAVAPTIPGGVISSVSGATANSFQLLRNRNGKNEPVISNMQTAKWAMATRTKINVVGATSMLYLCGLSDETAIDCFLGTKNTISGTNYVLIVGATPLDTGVAYDTSKDYTLVMFANGTAIQAYLGAADGTGLAAIGATVAQSNAANLPTAIRMGAFNQGTAASCGFQVDSILVLTERAA